MERQEGYYFVKSKGIFGIAKWEDGWWFMIYDKEPYGDSEFEHINENRIKTPGELSD